MKEKYPGAQLYWIAMSVIGGDILYCLYRFTEVSDRDTDLGGNHTVYSIKNYCFAGRTGLTGSSPVTIQMAEGL